MADVQKRLTKSGETRWDVRYRDHARGQRKRSFERKLDAERLARAVETDLLRGAWIGRGSAGSRRRRSPQSKLRVAWRPAAETNSTVTRPTASSRATTTPTLCRSAGLTR